MLKVLIVGYSYLDFECQQIWKFPIKFKEHFAITWKFEKGQVAPNIFNVLTLVLHFNLVTADSSPA